VRMPGAQVRLQTGAERSFLNAFVDLKKMRVSITHSNPNNFGSSFWRKGSNASDWQKKPAEIDVQQLFPQLGMDILRHPIEETERQVHLVRHNPTDSRNVRVEIRKRAAYRLRYVNGNEDALAHFPKGPRTEDRG
jgi:hypothetical protein